MSFLSADAYGVLATPVAGLSSSWQTHVEDNSDSTGVLEIYSVVVYREHMFAHLHVVFHTCLYVNPVHRYLAMCPNEI